MATAVKRLQLKVLKDDVLIQDHDSVLLSLLLLSRLSRSFFSVPASSTLL